MKISNNKKLSFMLAMIMIISSIISLGNISSVFADSSSVGEDVSKSVTNIQFSNESNSYKLIISFEENKDIEFKEGDYIDIFIKKDNIKSFDYPKNLTDMELKFEGKHIATVTDLLEKEEKIKIEFTKEANNLENITGNLSFNIYNIIKNDYNKDGNIVVEAGDSNEKLTFEKSESSGTKTDTILRKSNAIYEDGIIWYILVNEAERDFDNKQLHLELSDELDDTMTWDENYIKKERIIRIESKEALSHNPYWSYELDKLKIDSSGNYADLTLEEAEKAGILVDINGDEVKVKFEDNKQGNSRNPISNVSISIALKANLKEDAFENKDEVHNIVTVESNNEDFKNVPESDRKSSISKMSAEGNIEGYVPKKNEIYIKKVLEDTDIPIEGVKFQLEKQGSNEPVTIQETDNKGEIIFKDLDPGTYILKEIYAPEYIKLDEEEIEITIDNDADEGITLKIENSIKEIDIEVEKIWEGLSNSEEYETNFILLRNNEKIEKEATKKGNIYKFENLPKYDNEGKEYEYEVKEVGEEDNKVIINEVEFKVKYGEYYEENSDVKRIQVTNTKVNPTEPENPKPTKPVEPTEPDIPYERPGNPDKPKEESKPTIPNKNEPTKPEEPKEVEVEKPEEVEEPKETNVDSSEVESNRDKTEKEEVEEIKTNKEEPKKPVANVFDKNKAPQTGDEFSLALNLLVLIASVVGLYALTKKRK